MGITTWEEWKSFEGYVLFYLVSKGCYLSRGCRPGDTGFNPVYLVSTQYGKQDILSYVINNVVSPDWNIDPNSWRGYIYPIYWQKSCNLTEEKETKEKTEEKNNIPFFPFTYTQQFLFSTSDVK